MIRLPLEQFNYGTPPRPDISLELDPAGDGQVLLHIELETPDELAGLTLQAPRPVREELEQVLEQTRSDMSHARVTLAGEVRRLRELIASQRSLSRQLHPSEARELAAVLVHYAGESEAGRL